MVIVEELGKLFAQTFVALSLMAERDRPLEQVVLHLLGQIAPCGDSRAPENARKPFDLIACIHHGLLSFH
jgi:hypothetical protein